MKRIILSLVVLFTFGCAGNNPPQAVIAHYSTSLLQEVEVAQRGVISLNGSKLLSDDTTRKILDGIKVVSEKGAKLSAALKIYDAAAPGVTRDVALKDVSALVNDVNAAFALAFNIELPANVVGEVQALIANVNRTILSIQLELAKRKSVAQLSLEGALYGV